MAHYGIDENGIAASVREVMGKDFEEDRELGRRGVAWENDALYASRIFLNAALPLVKVLAEEDHSLKKAFSGKTGVVQVSAADTLEGAGAGARVGTHFEVTDGAVRVVPGLAEKADVELAFPSVEALNGFFSGKSMKLPEDIRRLAAAGPLPRLPQDPPGHVRRPGRQGGAGDAGGTGPAREALLLSPHLGDKPAQQGRTS